MITLLSPGVWNEWYCYTSVLIGTNCNYSCSLKKFI